MAILRDGDSTQSRILSLGPAGFDELVRALGLLGWSWDDKPRRGVPRVTHDRGWLRTETVPAQRLEHLGSALASVTGRPMMLRVSDAEVEIGVGSVDVRVEESILTWSPAGLRKAGAPVQRPEGNFDFDGESLASESVDAMVAEVIGGLDDLHGCVEASTFHGGGLRLPADDPHLARGPSATLRAGAAALDIDPAVRTALEDALRTAGRLDEETRPPDLSRWMERALRREGLAAEPRAGTPEALRVRETWLALTRETRGTPGRGGRLPLWRLTTEGRWPITEAEAAGLRELPSVPAPIRSHLALGGPFEIEIGPG